MYFVGKQAKMSVLVFGNHEGQARSKHSGASSVLCLLEEQDDSLKVFALEQLNANIEECCMTHESDIVPPCWIE